jgi:zinc/manganese transport system ATP-binding protein
MPPAIYIENADFGYPGNTVLANVSAELPSGSLVALTGANGSGKSTFLHTVLGLLPVLKGTVRFEHGEGGERGNGDLPIIGLVGQFDVLDNVYLFTGEEVALAGARLARPPAAPLSHNARERAADALKAVGAEEFAKRRFSEMSGGQRQRVLLARALALAPEVLALDEPVSGVDVESREAIATLLATLRDTAKMTILLSSHDPSFWQPLATHQIHFEDGVVEFGTHKE